MSLGTSQQILVIILAAFLALFLLLSIFAVILTIKILKHVKIIIAKAEQIADQAESVASFFQHTTGPIAVGKLISNIFNASRDRSNNERRKK